MRSDNRGYYSEEDFKRDFGESESGSGNSYGKRKSNRNRRRSTDTNVSQVGGSSGSGGYKGGGGRKKRSRKRTVLIVILCILALALAGTALGYTFVMSKLNKVSRVEVPRKDWGISPKAEEALKDYKHIAIMGVDSRKYLGEKEDTARSDSIVILSLNKKTNEMKIMSVYRDSYMLIENKGTTYLDKINHAHAFGGPIGLVRALNKNLDLNIDDFIRVNWETVADVTDSMGGLEVDVPKGTVGELNECISGSGITMKRESQAKLVKSSGKQQLNGVQIVGFTRMRYADGDDYRAGRSREVLSAVFAKAKTMKLSELNNTANVALSEIKTSMSSSTMLDMIMKMNSYKLANGEGWPYKMEGANIAGVYYSVPVTLKSNVQEMYKKMFGIDKWQPSKSVLDIDRMIKNRTGKFGNDGNSNNNGGGNNSNGF